MLKTVLDLLELNILSVERFRVHAEWRYQNVSSPYSRLYYIADGSGRIYFHKQKKEIRLRPGYMYLVPCFTLVDLYCPASFLHYYIHFTACMQNGFDLLTLVNCRFEASAKRHGIGEAQFERLYRLNPGRELIERDANKPIYKSTLERAMMLDRAKPIADAVESNGLLRLLLAPFLAADLTQAVAHTIEGMNRFEPVIKHIQANLTQQFTLGALSEKAGLHPTYFSNIFTQFMGISPMRYIQKMRIEKAQVMLLSSNDTLESVARQVGFDDVFYFMRIFKKEVGISPGRYRRLNHI
ncbi:MAG: AraC family transcriptional regulator [Planctomycetaceae bacterium]|nr:AraC family transcriptional regulator [Planctomycetaceae bacterium]